MRRVYVPAVLSGDLELPGDESHHLAHVLRLEVGSTIELFDMAGNVGQAEIIALAPGVRVRVLSLTSQPPVRQLTVAAAVPKADRADWMIEKLSEIGVTRFIPLRTRHSVVHPEGRSKLQRWERIAIEAAKQSHRTGVMHIDLLTPLTQLLHSADQSVDLSTLLALSTHNAPPLRHVAAAHHGVLLIGPEGGWSPEELAQFQQFNIASASLGSTILRIETAALIAAAILMQNDC
jgi:16S rRNA (uracil1498-N3)-methyltransferase